MDWVEVGDYNGDAICEYDFTFDATDFFNTNQMECDDPTYANKQCLPIAPKSDCTSPTASPTASPTDSPTNPPTKTPTNAPTNKPTKEPTNQSTDAQTNESTSAQKASVSDGAIVAIVVGNILAVIFLVIIVYKCCGVSDENNDISN
eukprot:816716_1